MAGTGVFQYLKRALGMEQPGGGHGVDELQSQLSRTLELIVDPEQLQGTIMGYITDLYHTRKAMLLMRNPETSHLQEVWQRGYEGRDEPVALPGEGRLARWLQVNEELLLLGEQAEIVGHLEADERDLLKEMEVDLCIPLQAMNHLTGLILLADLDAGSPVELPRNLIRQLGLALQNAAFYAQQQLRLRRLSRAERLATTGEMAASAAHEIRNPLTATSSAVQLMGEAFPAGNARREVADNVMREIDRINHIVEGLLSFARPSEPRREPIGLRGVLQEAGQLVQSMARKSKVEMSTDFAVEQDVVQADRDQLVQVFINLLFNSIQAMPEGGHLQLRLRHRRRFEIEIEDTGVGMTQEEIERSFDPFYTTKDRGTGLGLPICYGIVRSHGGEIDVESAPGQGTIVRVEL